MHAAAEALEYRFLLSLVVPTFTHVIIDSNPSNAGSDTLEKTLVDINGDGKLDAVLGEGTDGFNASNTPGGMFWYQAPSDGNLNEPWIKHTIAATGNFYERSVAYDVNGDGAMDIIASDNNQLVWFQNPRGSGGDDTQPWTMHVINPNAGAHDIRLADIDGDGKMDIVCSGSSGLGTHGYVAFQNSPTSWTNVQVANPGDGIATLDIGSGLGAINIAGVDPSGNVSWWENPREAGGNARTGTWTQHIIAKVTGATGASIATGVLDSSGRMDIAVCSNEVEDNVTDTQGLVWYGAPVDRRAGTWTLHTVDSSYRDVHQIDIADMNNDGIQDLVVTEQEQAAGDHPGTPSRVTVFYNDGAGNFTPSVLATTGGQNQVVGDIDGDGDLDILSANHGFYGAAHPLEIWVNNLKTLPSGGTTPVPLQNPGFESGVLSPWRFEGSGGSGIDNTPSHAHSGTDNGYIFEPNGFADLAQTVSVTPNTNYTFSAWVDAANTTAGKVAVKTTGGVDLASTALTNTDPGPQTHAGDYLQYSVPFNSGANSSIVVYAGYTGNGGVSFINVDDASLVQTTVVPPPVIPPPPATPSVINPGFETGSVTPWTFSGAGSYGIDNHAAHSHSGNDDAYIYGANGFASLGQTVTVAASTNYTYSLWVDASNTAAGLVGVRTAGGSVLGSVPIANTDPGPATHAGADYLLYNVNFNSGANTSVVLYAGYSGNGSGSFINIDDAAIAPTAAAAPAPTQVNLASSFNRVGIVSDGATFSATGGIDGGGNAYSTNLLGSAQTWNGRSYAIGAAGANNVVQATGQTIALTQGAYSTLSFLAAGADGNQPNQTFTVTYTDNTTQTFTQGFSDWFTPQHYAGESTVIAAAYRDSSNGTRDARTFNVYGYSFSLNSAKTIKSITLPSNVHVNLLAIDLS
jgi:hypothetical protein